MAHPSPHRSKDWPQEGLELREAGPVNRPGTRPAIPVRGTQSFVHTLSWCWRHPSLTALEILWRWIFGIPTLALLWYQAQKLLASIQLDLPALRRMTFLDPVSAAGTLTAAATNLLPGILHTAAWLAPVLLGAWIVISSLGRTAVLRRADPTLHARPLTLMALAAIRLIFLFASFALWFVCLQVAARAAITNPIAAGQEPSVVLYCALAIVVTLGLFVLWGIVSWIFSLAPLLAMLRDLAAAQSLSAALHTSQLRMKLVEINLVMGIVKICLIVLAMVFSACPLPFESIATPEFLTWWCLGVTVLYFIGSDFFHVARLIAYLRLWRDYRGAEIPH